MTSAVADPMVYEPGIVQPRPLSTVSVVVYAKSPISRAGVTGQLVGQPGIALVVPGPGVTADVAVVVTEAVDDEVIRVVRTIRRGGNTQVVLVAGVLDTSSMMAAIDAGAAGFLLSALATRARLVHVISGARHGSDQAADGGGRALHPAGRGLAAATDASPAPRLTPRELEVLRLVAEGYDTADIAARLVYSEPTIKNVIQRLFERLDARNRPHAVAVALRAGLI